MVKSARRVRVIVAEDSAVVRRFLVYMLHKDPEIEVVAEATNGAEAVELTKRLRPDLVLMDVVMPTMDGLQATREIMETVPTPIVLVTAGFDGDVNRSFDALEAGALTLLAKPTLSDSDGSLDDADQLTVTVKLMADVKLVRRRRRTATAPRTFGLADRRSCRVVAVASSTGGPAALATILAGLSADTPVPILVVQHITPGFHKGLVDWLDGVTALAVRLAADGQPLLPGQVVLAPSDGHLGVSPDGGRVNINRGPPIGGHRPSATHLFASVSRAFREEACGVVLTGMGRDGVAGLVMLKEAGGLVLAQDEASSVVYGMPREAAAMGVVDHVLPLDRIARALMAACAGRT